MSFNIRGALYDDGVNSWVHRSPLNISLIRDHAPDILGVQELHLANLTVYLKALPEYSFFIGPPYNNRQPFQYPTIFWKHEELHLVSCGGFWLSETPDRHSAAWDTDCVRSTAWVRLIWQKTGFEFLHINTHLDHISEPARQNGAELIVRQIDSHLPAILTGDFNCLPGSPVYHTFRDHGFNDTYEQAGHSGPAFTFHNFEGIDFRPRTDDFDRIDWILTRDWGKNMPLDGFSIIKDAAPPLYPSDHYPIMAVFRAAEKP